MAVRKVGDDEKAVKRVTCHRCGSILEYLLVDVKNRVHTDYSGTSETLYWIDCPQCQSQIEVKAY